MANNEINISGFLPELPERVLPQPWVLPNRRGFVSWMDKTYDKYRDKTKIQGKFDLFNHQKLVRDYINADSPYRGILLYHGLGVGKTCASIS